MKTITKTPGDVRPFSINYSLALPSGVLIDSGTVTAKDYQDNDLTSTLIDSIIVADTKITAFIKGGTAGLRAKILYRAVCDDEKTIIATTVPLIVSE